ncbi:hypothetical protein MMC10_010307 [Thelotrema lepadinum]|nr:hypothetical protein [Thelotrema lepadinum]
MSGRWFPKRLIDIGPDDEKLRIIETSETLPTGPYASFSHCWGKQPDFFILTAENLAEVKHRIPLELLAPNFRDAVKTSRCLGIRYLWIDSLCILQRGEGSGKDWTEHMVAMRDVYACCVLNISADRAAGAKDGFLGSHSLNLGSPVLVNHPTLPLHRLVDLGLAHTCLGRSPLAKRAWVFQERWLSPRILHFTAYQVFWECHTRRLACEAFPDHCPTNADCNAYSGDSTQEDHRWSPTMAPFAQDWLALKDRHGWYQILEEYTSRQLSFPSKDKFHALAGVVKQVQQRWPDEYIARLFRSDLPLALLWGIDPDRIVSDVDLMPLKPNGSAYRGPSWSWTAHDRSLTYSLARACLAEGKNVTYAEVINASVLPADPNNLLGPVLSAQLLIRGHVCNARWGSNGHKAKSAGRLELMRKDGSSMSHKCEYEAALDNPNMSEHSDLWPDGMIILLVAEVMGKHIFFRDAGLLLVPDSSSDREIGQKWRRIGVWMNHRNDEESAAAVMGSVEPSMLTIV